MISTINRLSWDNVEIIFAIVYERDEDFMAPENYKLDLDSIQKIPVLIKKYTYSSLQSKYGVINK